MPAFRPNPHHQSFSNSMVSTSLSVCSRITSRPPSTRWPYPADPKASAPLKLTPCVSSKKLSRSAWLRISEPRASPQIVMGPAVAACPQSKQIPPRLCIQLRYSPPSLWWCMYLHTRGHDALLPPALPTILHSPTARGMSNTEEAPHPLINHSQPCYRSQGSEMYMNKFKNAHFGVGYLPVDQSLTLKRTIGAKQPITEPSSTASRRIDFRRTPRKDYVFCLVCY